MSEAQAPVQPVDVLAIGAHPDDVEFTCGGTLLRLAAEGKKIAIVDCTRGEMGSRGNADIRDQEAQQAAEMLNVVERVNLEMPDGMIEPSLSNATKIVQVLRYFQPTIVLFPPAFERHPDHEVVHRLVRRALFLSGLARFETTWEGQVQPRWIIKKAFSYMQVYEFQPDFFVDISPVFEHKMALVRAYRSQVYTPGAEQKYGPQTFISSADFLEMLESRARYFGALIGVQYAEAFQSLTPVGLPSLSVFL